MLTLKLKTSSELFADLDPMRGMASDKIIPYIDRFLTISPNAGLYEVDDRPYVSKVKDVRNMHFHPSGDCLKCMRLLYWERDPDVAPLIERRFDAKTQMIFKMGDAVHAMIQAWFSAMDGMDGFPDLVANEFRFDDDTHSIGGFMDSVLVFPGSQQPIAIEIKSISSYGFGKLGASPKADHKQQIGIYTMELDAPFGIVLYMNKDTCELKEYKVDAFDMMPTLMRWAKVRQAVFDGNIDLLEPGCKVGEGKDWEWCPARDICLRRKLSRGA